MENYQNIQTLGDWTVMVKKHSYPDVFLFRPLSPNILQIKRLQGAWGMNLEIALVSDDETIQVPVGPCRTDTTQITFDKDLFQSLFQNTASLMKDVRIHTSNVIAVPSVIHPSCRSYKKNHISDEERYNQTLKQVKGIKDYIPDSTVILLESSFLSTVEIDELSRYCDYVVLCHDDVTYHYCHEHNNIGLGEFRVLELLFEQIGDQSYDHFFKFGGRYSFSSTFDLQQFKSNVPTGRVLRLSGIPPLLYTNFYSIPRGYIASLKESIRCWLYQIGLLDSIEYVMYLYFQSMYHYNDVASLGVEGMGATDLKVLYL